MICERMEPIFSAYLAGEADARDRVRAEAHLLDCEECREELALAKLGWDAARDWEVPGPSPALDVIVAPVVPRVSRVVRILQVATGLAAVVMIACMLVRPAPARVVPTAPVEPVAAYVPPGQASVGVLACVDPETGKAVGELSIKSLKLTVEIADGVAQTTVEEIFTNETDQRLEGTFIFPLPPDASITRLAMDVGETLVEGECVERKKAQETYEGIVRKMKDPALLEWMPGGLFKCRIFPIEPHSDKRIIIGYQQALPVLDGRAQYVYPLVSETTRERAIGTFGVEVRTSGVRAKGVTYPLRHEERGFRARKDVVVDVEFDAPEFSFAAHRTSGPGYVTVFVTPRPDAVERARETAGYVFLVDCSASVSEPELEVARKLVKRMIESARGSVVVMGHHVTLQVSGEGRAEALDLLPKLASGGACDLGRALVAAMRAAPDGGEVVYVGEGTPTMGETDVAKIVAGAREACGGKQVTFRAVAVGSDADRATLGAVATAFHGGVHAVSASDDVERRVAEIARTLGRPAMTDVKVEIEGSTEAAPASIGSLYFGERAVVAARYASAGRVKAVLTGRVQGREVRREFVLELPAEEKRNLHAKRLWAQRRVADLLAKGEAARAEVTALGVAEQLMTPYTSFLVLESERAYEEHRIDRTKKAQESLVAKASPEQQKVVEGNQHLQQAFAHSDRDYLQKVRDARRLEQGRVADLKQREAEAEASAHELARRAEASEHYRLAEHYYQSGDFTKAEIEAQKALQADSSHAAAHALALETQFVMGKGTATPAAEEYQKLVQRSVVRHQQTLLEIDDKLGAGVRAYNTGNYEEAEQGFRMIQEYAKWLPESAELTARSRQAADMLVKTRDGQRRKTEDESKVRLHIIEEEKARDELRKKCEQKRELELLFGQAQLYFEQESYGRCKEICDRMLRMNPNLGAAEEMGRVAQRLAHSRVEAGSAAVYLRQWKQLLDDVDLPQHVRSEDLSFSAREIWQDVVAKRKPKGIADFDAEALTPEDQEILDKLRVIRLTLDLQEAPLPGVVDYVREITGLNFIIDTKAIPDPASERITLRVNDIIAEGAIKLMLREHGHAHVIEGGVVVITSAEALQTRSRLELYDVQDLTWGLQDFPGIDISLARDEADPAPAVDPRNPEFMKAFSHRREVEEEEDPEILAIDRTLRTLRLDGEFENATPLDIIDFLRDYTGLTIVLDAGARREIGPKKISIKWRELPLRHALALLTKELDLEWHVSDEKVVLITTKPKMTGDDLVSLVKGMLPLDDWSEAAGKSVQFQNGLLIVRNTAPVHRKVCRLLTQLRERGWVEPPRTATDALDRKAADTLRKLTGARK